MSIYNKIIIGLIFVIMFILGLGAWDIRQNNIKSIVSSANAGIFDDIGTAISGHFGDIKDRILVDEEYVTGKVIEENEFKYTKDSIHWAKGSVSIIKANGKTYIQLGNDFEAGLAPDLYILTSPDIIKTQFDLDKAPKENLIKLKRGSGASVYEIDEDTDIKSIVIWCQAFNQFMGSSVL